MEELPRIICRVSAPLSAYSIDGNQMKCLRAFLNNLARSKDSEKLRGLVLRRMLSNRFDREMIA